ncbi:solute carrier family 22 member 6 isoform X2 [Anabrus simplex]|uniref:solute carrier family 22 member 6 isoform X2 n=1 Tax=Anabrus simplex TaxID=316456 RepID=UPI0035A280D1
MTMTPEKTSILQVCLLLLMSVNYSLVAMNHALPTFHGYTPLFHCQGNNMSTTSQSCVAANTSSLDVDVSSCPGGYTFEALSGERKLVAEWQLVCERRVLLPLAATLYFCGVTVGAVVCGMLADWLGRRLVMLLCLLGQALLAVAIYFSGSLLVFMVLRVIQGFFVQGMQGATYTLLVELFPPRIRTAVGVILEIYWALGLAALAGFDYIVPDWRYLQLTIAAPTLLTLFYVCLIPESPRWLSSQGRHEEAQKVWMKIAPGPMQQLADEKHIENGPKNGPIEMQHVPGKAEDDAISTDGLVLGAAEKNCDQRDLDVKVKAKKSNILELLQKRVVRKHTFIMTYIWFSVSLSYYGITFYLPALSGDRHINFLWGSILEMAAFILAFCILVKFGRRLPLCLYLLVSGAVCIAVAGISMVPPGTTTWSETMRTVFTLMGKASVVSAFCSIFLYTSELFPTVLRAAAMGLCGFWGRVGSLISPQLLLVGEYTYPAVPMACMGVLCLAAGFATLSLPETLGLPLPDTIEEAQKLSRKNDKKREPS